MILNPFNQFNGLVRLFNIAAKNCVQIWCNYYFAKGFERLKVRLEIGCMHY